MGAAYCWTNPNHDMKPLNHPFPYSNGPFRVYPIFRQTQQLSHQVGILYISHCKTMMVCKLSYHGLSTPIRQMVSLSHYTLINCLYYGLLVGSYSSLTINQSVNSLKVYNPSWTRDSFNIGSNHCFTATRLQALSSRHWSSQKPSAFLRRAAAATRSVACFDPKIPTDFPIKTGDFGYPLVICDIAIEHEPFSSWIYPLISGDFPVRFL